jgi:hypothetical protein
MRVQKLSTSENVERKNRTIIGKQAVICIWTRWVGWVKGLPFLQVFHSEGGLFVGFSI